MRPHTRHPQHFLPRAAALLPAFFVLLAALCAGWFALPAVAAPEDVDEVLTRLATLQNTDVDPSWPPDVEAGAASIEAMLDAYRRCTADERKNFTVQQNADLRSYFDALYTQQERDTAELDSLFAGGTGSQAAPSGASASVPASAASSDSSFPSSSQASGSTASSSSNVAPNAQTSSGASTQASSATSSSASSKTVPGAIGAIQGTHNPPQIPRGEGLGALLGNSMLGGLLMALLMALSVIAFVRFAMAQHAAERDAKLRDVLREAADAAKAPAGNAVVLPFVLNAPAEEEETPAQDRRRERQLKREAREAKRAQKANALDRAQDNDAHLWTSTPEEQSVWNDPLASLADGWDIHPGESPAGKTDEREPPDDDVSPRDEPLSAVQQVAEWQLPSEDAEPAALKPLAPHTGPPAAATDAGDTKHPSTPVTGRPRRTGRPARMPFRVGSEDDPAGIDD